MNTIKIVWMYSVQVSSVAQSCLTLCDPWIAARQASLFITNSHSSLKLMPIKESEDQSENILPCSVDTRCDQFSSVQSLSRVRLFATHESQHARPPCPSPEFTQTHVHRVRDAIQPSHPRSSPSPPAPNPSQHQSLFQWVNSSHEVAKVLEFQL